MFETSNFYLSKFIVKGLFQGRLITLHISDNDGIDERHWMPGQGVIVWQQWAQILVTMGYAFPFIYELVPWCINEPKMIQEICRNAEIMFGIQVPA